MEPTYSPIKIPIFTLKEVENQVLCFNNIIQAAGLRIDCRGRPVQRQKMRVGGVKVVVAVEE